MNDATTARPRATPYAAHLLGAPAADLGHIPGRAGWPVVGSTLEYFADQEAWSYAQHRRYGRVWRSHVLFHWGVVFQGADAAETILLDRDKNFSSHLGWSQNLGAFFSGGLMLRDFDDHRFHRRLLQAAFRRAAVEGYVAQMHPTLVDAAARWPVGRAHRFYPRVKRLLLDLAATVFLGVPLGAESDRVREAFTALTLGTVAVVPYAVPGLARWKALRSREYLQGYLRGLIPARRGGAGADMFSQLCRETDEEGGALTDDEVVDHMIFLLMAAHDTTTSGLTTLVECLGRHPEWQERLREEVRALGTERPEASDLDRMALADLCWREALRLYPPVPTMPRRTLRACEIDGVAVPANAAVWLDFSFIHRDPAHWTRPEVFDPERFGEGRAEHKRHRFCWVPFGGGAHTCIGAQFATLQAKLVLFHLLRGYGWTLADAGSTRRQMVPFPKLRNDLPLVFARA
ncbi:MAG: cytochrome [Myxococcaceae bacterium]|nr:cytochrome [Myxococcaceae bacterium]